jgi:hypothetical protein
MRSRPHQNLLVPKDFDQQCRVDVGAQKLVLRFLTLYPFAERATHADSILQPLCAYIDNNYRLQDAIDAAAPDVWIPRYEVWTPR